MADSPKSFWESSLLTTMVTVLGTAVLGNFVASGVQDRSKRNEMALTAYRDNQTAQVSLVKEVYDLVGQYTAAGNDLIYITGEQFADDNYAAADAQLNHKWFRELRATHDKVDATWRQKKFSLGYLLSFHYHGRKEVGESWRTVVSAVDKFEACVDIQARLPPGSRTSPELPCQHEETAVDEQVGNLTRTLEVDSAPLWEEVHLTSSRDRCLWLFC